MITTTFNLGKGMKTKYSDDNYQYIKNQYFGSKAGGIYYRNEPVKLSWYEKSKQEYIDTDRLIKVYGARTKRSNNM